MKCTKRGGLRVPARPSIRLRNAPCSAARNPRCRCVEQDSAQRLYPRYMDVAECQSLADQGKATFLDVRTPREFEHSHITGASNVPVKISMRKAFWDNPDFVAKVASIFPDKDSTLLVACTGVAGDRAALAIHMLEADGYHNLIQVRGGFMGWASQYSKHS